MTDRPRKLERNRNDKVIAGVASGVADFFGLDRTLVRVLWALSIFLGGLGIVIYIIMWIVVPVAGSDRSVAHNLRDRTESSPPPSNGSEPESKSASDHETGADESAG